MRSSTLGAFPALLYIILQTAFRCTIVFTEDGNALSHYSNRENKAFYDSSAILETAL